MGKIIDFLMTGSWEQYKRVQLYKKLGKTLDNLSDKQLEKIKKILEEGK